MITTLTRSQTATMVAPIGEIHCCECAYLLQLSLEAYHGVESADVDCEAGSAVIVFRPEDVSWSELTRAIRSEGYDVPA